MSKIAREITKKVSIIALSASLLLQTAPVSAAEAVKTAETENAVVSEETNKIEPVKEDVKEEKALDTVSIPDENFKILLHKTLGLSQEKELTKSDLARVHTISIEENDGYEKIKSLEGIQYCSNIKSLVINDIDGIDISAARNLTTLTYLVVKNGTVDLNDLSNLISLEVMEISKISNTNLDGLKNLKSMFSIEIFDGSNVNDISGISNMEGLAQLRVIGTEEKRSPLTDISVIAQLPELTNIDFSYTSISDISILAKTPNVRNAVFGFCNISDISNLINQVPERIYGVIWLNGNKIADPTPIFKEKYYYQIAPKQEVTLPEIVTKGGNVTYKLPYADYLTEVHINEEDGSYNPETKEITFYNVTSDKKVTYTVRANRDIDADTVGTGKEPENGGYDYTATITQAFRIGDEDAVVTTPDEGKTEETGTVSNTAHNTSTVKDTKKSASKADETSKTGDAGAFGALSLAVMSIAGAVKSRKRK